MAVRPNPTSCEPEPPLVGFEDDKRKIMSALLDTSEPGFSVVHIIGPRGVGKTHLAKEIYTSPEVQERFRVRIWVSASCSYYRVEDEDFKNMRAQLSIEHEADISRFLTGRRYCVVIDDQDWRDHSRKKAWDYIVTELPKYRNGSRVLVTCRPDNGRSRFPRTREFEVGPRSNEESLEILLNDAFSKYPWEDCPAGEVDDLSLEIRLKTAFPKYLWEGCPAGKVDDLVMKFVRKCKALPWPLQFMGGLLSLCPWNELQDRIQTIEAARMNFVDLAMRYRDLPSHEMRAAFLYFLTFPEDAEIHAESFALLLKSEGITSSSEEGKDTLELLAERSMIEVTKWHSDGSIKCCRLHDPLLRLLAIHEAKEKRFVWKNDSSILDLFDARKELPSGMVKKNHKFGGKFMEVEQLSDASIIFNFGGNFQLETALMSDRVLEIDDTINKADVAREVKRRGELKHLGLNNLRLLPEIMKINGWDKHLTTIVIRDTSIETLPSNELLKLRSLEHLSLRNTKVSEIPELPESLKTLDVGGTPIETLPESSPWPYLTTLLLRNTKVREIPKSFEKLEYLDVRDTFVQSLPNSLWKNRQLKSILASDTLEHLNGPPPRADLSLLRILETVHVPEKWGKKLPKFHYLEKLGLSYFKNAFSSYNTLNWGIIIELLSTLQFLSSLKIQGSNIPAIIIEVTTCPSYERLKNLWVGGSYSLFSLNITMPPELTSLTLENLEFDKDPMPTLGELRRLKTLHLRRLLYSAQIKKMMCSNGGFRQLKRLQVSHIYGLEEWSVEERALPRVTRVVIDSCKALKDLSGPLVARTTPLKELHLHAMPPELTKKFSHLQFVKITEN